MRVLFRVLREEEFAKVEIPYHIVVNFPDLDGACCSEVAETFTHMLS
jgi:hypothetical protein